MDISLAENSEEKVWDDFVTAQPRTPFLQSWAMGDFYRSLGQKVWPVVLKQKGQIQGVCLTTKVASRLGTFLYVPAGPIGNWRGREEELCNFLTESGRAEGCSFIRFDPRVEREFTFRKAKNAPAFTQPECTLVLDLTSSLEEIKSHFSESTRYNVGWVARQGVRVEVSQSREDFKVFGELLSETSARQNFRLYKQEDYYEKQFAAFLKRSNAKLFFAREPAKVGEEVLASAVVIYYGDTVTYLHAASSAKNPKLRAPYLMQWSIIEDAKKGDFTWYDFWGVAKNDSPKDSWAGVTAFKKGFGGERLCYQRPVDLPLHGGYYVSHLLETWRKPLSKLLRL